MIQRIEIRFFEIQNKISKRRILRAQHFDLSSPDAINKLLERILKKAEAMRPGNIWQIIRIAEAKYNIVWRGFVDPKIQAHEESAKHALRF